MRTLAVVVALLCWTHESLAGLTVTWYNNSAFVDPAVRSASTTGFVLHDPQPFEEGTVTVYGSLSAPPSSIERGGGDADSRFGYAYQCLSNADITFVWIDDHLVCHQGIYANPPSSMDGSVNTSLPFLSKRTVPVRAHLYYGQGSSAPYDGPVLGTLLNVTWCRLPTQYPLNTSHAALCEPTVIPNELLNESLTSIEVEREALQKSEAVGWGTWLPGSILSMVHLPDGATLTVGFRNTTTGEYVDADTIDGTHPVANVTVRVGLHRVNRSYAQFFYAWRDSNVSIEYFTDRGTDPQPQHSADSLAILVTPLTCLNPTSGMCDVEVWISWRFAWFRNGVAEWSGESAVSYTPQGLSGFRVYANVTPSWSNQSVAVYPLRTIDGALAAPLCFSSSFGCAYLPLERRGYPLSSLATDEETLASVTDAVEAALLWNYVFVPAELGPVLPVSRSWDATRRLANETRTDWGYILFDWDNYFASLMASRFSRGMSYSNLIQITRSKAAMGFIPNICAGGAKAQDRTEPVVGVTVLREVARYFNDTWIEALLWNDMWDWLTFMRQHRMGQQLEPSLLPLISLGSDYVVGYTDPTMNSMMGARKESGITNSPMYDGDFFDNITLHLMELYDVGFSSLVARQAQDLAAVLRDLMPVDYGSIPPAEELSFLPGHAQPPNVTEWQEFGDSLAAAISQFLWNEELTIPCNLWFNQTFHARVSPTSFYALLANGSLTTSQVDLIASRWLLNESRFCLSASWPAEVSKTCYWGLPSISADDPAFPALGYWRGYVWGPMALLTYLGLAQFSAAASPAWVARQALVLQMRTMGMQMWTENRHICENFSPHQNATDCTGTLFYHWGALTLFLTILENEAFPSATSTGATQSGAPVEMLIGVPTVIAFIFVVHWTMHLRNQQRNSGGPTTELVPSSNIHSTLKTTEESRLLPSSHSREECPT